MKHLMTAVGIAIASAMTFPAAGETLSKDIAARIEAIPIQTLTISDEQFLKGDAQGKPTIIAGVLRIAQGSGRLPLVIFVAGSGGFGPVTDSWDRQFEALGISTFTMDSFAARGIVNTIIDQSQLGWFNMILDLYRSIAVLAAHPRVDPNRIVVMGWSRGGRAVLYSSLRRFQKMWNPGGVEPARLHSAVSGVRYDIDRRYRYQRSSDCDIPRHFRRLGSDRAVSSLSGAASAEREKRQDDRVSGHLACL
jgi:acetyl esterase/lipase